MRFSYNVLKNAQVIGKFAMTFLGSKFSFKLDLYFIRYMHANTKNKK